MSDNPAAKRITEETVEKPAAKKQRGNEDKDDMEGTGYTSSSPSCSSQQHDIHNLTVTFTEGDKVYSYPVSRTVTQSNDGTTPSTSNTTTDTVTTASNAYEETAVVNSSEYEYTPPQYEYSPQLSEPKTSCVSSTIRSYITYATREYRGEMMELSVYCIGKEAKSWNIKTHQHSGSDITAVDLGTALADLSSWLQDIAKPLLFVGCTEFICLLNSVAQQNPRDHFKSIIEGFTFIDTKNTKKTAFKDMFGKREMITLGNEKDPVSSASKLSEIIETKMETKGRGEILEILAKNSRTFNNALDLSSYRVKVEENKNSEFEDKSLATLMSRKKIRLDVGKKMASVGLTYKDICLMYRSFKSLVGTPTNIMMYHVFNVRNVTPNHGRVDEVIEMLEKDGN